MGVENGLCQQTTGGINIHFLLVKPAYLGIGVGKELFRMAKEKSKVYLMIVLIADETETGFYQNSNFERGLGTIAVFINKFI